MDIVGKGCDALTVRNCAQSRCDTLRICTLLVTESRRLCDGDVYSILHQHGNIRFMLVCYFRRCGDSPKCISL
jgi:hypothetical protein